MKYHIIATSDHTKARLAIGFVIDWFDHTPTALRNAQKIERTLAK